MKAHPKINRRGWLAIWLQKRRRKRLQGSAPVAAIVLSSDGHGRLTWTYNFTTPYGFSIYRSVDGVTWGLPFDGANIGAVSADESGNAGYFRICQADWEGADVLPYSNAVYSDGL